MALAGKGFTPEVESGYRSKHPEMNFAQVDQIEGFKVDPATLQTLSRKEPEAIDGEAWLALLILVAFVVGGCGGTSAIMPAAAVASKGASKATEAARPITDSEEYYVGRAVAAQILSRYKLDQNPNLTQYVNEVGQTVARKSSRPNPFKGYHFAVLDTTEINAFACPGGIIFVTRGLIQTCKNEDQLAAVLAHEVGHVANKDGINSITQARWTQVFAGMGTEAAKQYRRGGRQPGEPVRRLHRRRIQDHRGQRLQPPGGRDRRRRGIDAELTGRVTIPPPWWSSSPPWRPRARGPPAASSRPTRPPASALAKVKGSVGQSPADSKGEKIRTERFKKIVS